MTAQTYHLHLVSDATGETITSITRACLVQFENINVEQHIWSLIRTPRQLGAVISSLRQKQGLVLYTFVDEDLRRQLEDSCRMDNIQAVPVLDPVLKAMAGFFGMASGHRPGRQHELDADYFARIAAMDFALARDDGHGTEHLEEADVVILGVSRTSKTPTCLYLANRGIKAANIPLIPGQSPPAILEKLQKPLIIGLTNAPETLVEIRRNRLQYLQENRQTAYTDPDLVRAEVQEARRVYARLGCPVIDVSRRSIEETAAEIMTLLTKKKAADANR
jgi:hypothetical protein